MRDRPSSLSKPFAIVTGDFTPWGGMDRPNYELAWYLAEQWGSKVHLVGHCVAEPLSTHPNVIWHRVPRPFRRHVLGSYLLCRRGIAVAKEVTRAGGTVIVNGGNCLWGDVNWIHYVHNVVSDGGEGGPFLRRQWARWNRRRNKRRERLAVGEARIVITDSDLAKDRLIAGTSIDPGRIRTIYYGVDSEAFRPADAAGRAEARRSLGLPPDRPVVAFIGALGIDRRKGFDVLFDAWRRCHANGGWDAILLVAGAGSELHYWQRRVVEAGQEDNIQMLGFAKNIPSVLAAADALVSPTRFEPYGQGVHEALCCGLPAFVTRCAGIAERYPADLNFLLLDDPPNATQLCDRLMMWYNDIETCRLVISNFSDELRRRTWSDMAAEIVQAMIGTATNDGIANSRIGF